MSDQSRHEELADIVDGILRGAAEPMTADEILDAVPDPDVTEEELQKSLAELTAEGSVRGQIIGGQPMRFRLATREEKDSDGALQQPMPAAKPAPKPASNPEPKPDAAKSTHARTQPLVYGWLQQHGGGTAQQVADGTGLRIRQCQNALTNLAKAGHIKADARRAGLPMSWSARRADVQSAPAKQPEVEGTAVMRPPLSPPAPTPSDNEAPDDGAPRWAVWSDGSVEIEVSAAGRVRLSADDARKLIEQVVVMTSRHESQAA